MNDFDLRPSNEPQPKLLDEEIVTATWPTPAPLADKARDVLTGKAIPADSMLARATRVIHATLGFWWPL